MQDRPTAIELIEAVQQHLNSTVIPRLREPQLRFRTLVAANVLGVVARELALAPDLGEAEWQRLARLLGKGDATPPAGHAQRVQAIEAMNEALCREIEAGAFDDPAGWQQLLTHCRQTAREKLTIANPTYLARAENGE